MIVDAYMLFLGKQTRAGKNGQYQVVYLGQENAMPEPFIIPNGLEHAFDNCLLGDILNVKFDIFRGRNNSRDYWKMLDVSK